MLKFSISGAMIAAALIWGGSTQAKVEQIPGIYTILVSMNTRLANIEGAMGIKSDKKSAEKEE